MNAHRLAELRSLELHRAIAAQLRDRPQLITEAQRRLDAGRIHPEYAAAWREILARDIDAIVAILCSDDERARALRQATPFAFAISPRERWRIWRAVRERFA
jgi:hypothetical protein